MRVSGTLTLVGRQRSHLGVPKASHDACLRRSDLVERQRSHCGVPKASHDARLRRSDLGRSLAWPLRCAQGQPRCASPAL